MNTETTNIAASRMHPDVFTREEAASYLHLDNPTTVDWCREKGFLAGHKVGLNYMYHRSDLDGCVLSLFGKTEKPVEEAGAEKPKGKANGKTPEGRAALRLVGGRS